MSFIIILSCNSVAHSICTPRTLFVIYANLFHQKANKQPLEKKKEIEKHKVGRQHWPNPKTVLTLTNQEVETPAVCFHLLTQAGVSDTFSFPAHLQFPLPACI